MHNSVVFSREPHIERRRIRISSPSSDQVLKSTSRVSVALEGVRKNITRALHIYRMAFTTRHYLNCAMSMNTVILRMSCAITQSENDLSRDHLLGLLYINFVY